MGMRNRFGEPGLRPGNKAGGPTHVDMTPLIDIVLLLLIFFMVTSVLSPKVRVDVPTAVVTTTVDPADSVVLTVRAGKYSTDPARVLLGDGDGPGQDPSVIREAIEREAATGRRRVLVRAERRVRNQTILDLAEMVAEIEDGQLFFAVEPINEAGR